MNAFTPEQTRLKPGYLPAGAAAIFSRAQADASEYPPGDYHRSAIFERAHSEVRSKYPSYFRKLN